MAPRIIKSLLLSPIDPGIQPQNMFIHEKSNCANSVNKLTAFSPGCDAGTDKAVAPEYPSGPATHTLSPDILLG